MPPFLSIYRTGERIQRMEERAGIVRTVEPVLGLLLGLLWSLYPIYYQSHLNKVWDAALAAGARAQAVGQPPAAEQPQAVTPPPVPPPPAGA